MLFKKEYGELVQDALAYLENNTSITNMSIGGIARSMVEAVNKSIADYYGALDINMAMSFLSTAEGYFLDLTGDLFNMDRLGTAKASATADEGVQKFYVTTETLYSKIGGDTIESGTQVSSSNGDLVYTVTEDVTFSTLVTEVYVPIIATNEGSRYNAGKETITSTNLGITGVYTVNVIAISGGSDLETDSNYRYRLSNATNAAEKANEIAVRLAALSVPGVADIIAVPYARGIGSYDVIVIPVEGIATSSLIASVQTAIEGAQAFGIKGTATAPRIVDVDITVSLSFVDDTSDANRDIIRTDVKSAIEDYTVNIPIGDTFILNELRQRIMETSESIRDHDITCYYFRGEPYFLKNVEIYWDEMFYPNRSSVEAIKVF